jgi:hypothetical protein
MYACNSMISSLTLHWTANVKKISMPLPFIASKNLWEVVHAQSDKQLLDVGVSVCNTIWVAYWAPVELLL